MPDVADLTPAKRLTCHIAHKEFVDLVNMDTYEVKTHGICSSHCAEAGTHENAAYDADGSGLLEHGVHHFHGRLIDAYRSLVGVSAGPG